jgi:Gluconate 2-dehydrogenase subunit 3
MPISRRTALKQAFIVAGGVIFLPACTHHTDNSTTLEALADTLIPADTTPGAKATGAHLFAQKMMQDCYPPKQQQQYARGRQAFDEQAQKQYGKAFADCDQTQRNAFVAALDASKTADDDLHYFFRQNKRLVIQGYLGSQYFLTKIEVYELVPGRWHGCVPVTKKS